MNTHIQTFTNNKEMREIERGQSEYTLNLTTRMTNIQCGSDGNHNEKFSAKSRAEQE